MRISAIRQRSDYKWWVFGALAIGTFTGVADHGSVNVALPSIADYFETDLPTVQWVVLGYALAISAFLLPMGRLSDIIGRKKVYIVGMLIFVIGAALAGSSTNVMALIGAKIFQGFGSGITQGTAMAMVLATFSDSERGKALGFQMSVVGTGGVAGPAVGGFLVSAFGWRSVFYINVLLGGIALIAALIILEERRAAQDGRQDSFDWLGAALSTAALLTFLLGMTAGSRMGWTSPAIILTMLAFLALLSAFVWWELRIQSPMFDVRLFKRKLFAFGISASFISFLGMSASRFLMPFYLQAVLGYSPIKVGLIVIPGSLIMIVAGPLSGRLSDRFGWRWFNVGGLTLSAIGLFSLSALKVDSSLALVLTGMIFQSAGMGMFNAPNNSSIMSAVERSKYGTISGFLNLVRNASNVTSIALGTAIVTGIMASQGYAPTLAGVSESGDAGLLAAFTSGLKVSFLAMGSVLILGIAVSFFKGTKSQTSPSDAESVAVRH